MRGEDSVYTRREEQVEKRRVNFLDRRGEERADTLHYWGGKGQWVLKRGALCRHCTL